MLVAFGFLAYSQQPGDSIEFNSTCVSYKIKFGSSLFDRVTFPTKVLWNFGDPASGFYNSAGNQAPTHLYTAPGKYYLSLLVVNAGDSIKLSDSIDIVTPMSYDFGPDIYLCAKSDTTLKAPVIPGATYLWNDDSLSRDTILHVVKTGVYTVQVNGCAVADSIGVFYSETPEIKIGKDHQLCAGEVLTLNATTQNGNYTWKLNGTVIPGAADGQLLTSAPGGEYIVAVTVPGCGVFSDTAAITYSTVPAPQFSLGPDTLLCPREIFPLSADVTGAIAYDWNTGDNTASINITSRGYYYAFVTTAGGCQVVDTMEARYRGDKNLDFRDTAICKGSTLILDADFGTGTYQWVSDPPQRNDQNQTGQSTYYVYEPGLYSVTAQVGTCIYKDSLRVTFNDSLKMNLGRDTAVCIGQDLLLHLTINTDNYAWQDGSTGLTHNAIDSGIYRVTAENGCGKDTVAIRVIRKACDCDLHMPNAFTPNLDGKNDMFKPARPCKMTSFQMRIFDRFGKLVFQSEDFTRGWNGTYGGIPSENGTYIWVVTYINTDSKSTEFRKGFVVLLH